jgi:hypothetical protein
MIGEGNYRLIGRLSGRSGGGDGEHHLKTKFISLGSRRRRGGWCGPVVGRSAWCGARSQRWGGRGSANMGRGPAGVRHLPFRVKCPVCPTAPAGIRLASPTRVSGVGTSQPMGEAAGRALGHRPAARWTVLRETTAPPGTDWRGRSTSESPGNASWAFLRRARVRHPVTSTGLGTGSGRGARCRANKTRLARRPSVRRHAGRRRLRTARRTRRRGVGRPAQ